VLTETPADATALTRVAPSPRASAGVRALLGAGALALLFLYCLALWYDWLPWLRGWGNYPEGWTWPTYAVPPLERFLPAFSIVAAIWIAVLATEWLLGRLQARQARCTEKSLRLIFLGVLVLLGAVFQLTLIGLRAEVPLGVLFERVNNRHVTSYFTFASRANGPDSLFRDYIPASANCLHCQGHPPGPSVFYWLDLRVASLLPESWQSTLAGSLEEQFKTNARMVAAREGLTDTQFLAAFAGGAAMLLVASLVVVPLYGIARLLGPAGWEFRLAALGLALPGLMLMAPMFDQVYATLAALALYLALRSLSVPGPLAGIRAAGAGAVLALGILFTWALGTIAVVVAAVGAAYYLEGGRLRFFAGGTRRPKSGLHGLLIWGMGLIAGFIVPIALLEALAQPDLIHIFNHNMAHVAEAEGARPYWVWLLHGPLDFVQFLGLPLALGALLTFFGAGTAAQPHSDVRAESEAPEPWYSRVNVYALLFWLSVAGLALAGRSKAEQGRLLIFLMPLALVAIYFWAGRNRPDKWVIALLFFAQMLVCITIGARWVVPT